MKPSHYKALHRFTDEAAPEPERAGEPRASWLLILLLSTLGLGAMLLLFGALS